MTNALGVVLVGLGLGFAEPALHVFEGLGIPNDTLGKKPDSLLMMRLMPTRSHLRLSVQAVVLLIVACVLPAWVAGETARTGARFAVDGRSYTISAPGLTTFRAGYSTTVEMDGVCRTLDSTAGRVVETKTEAAVPGAYGSATVTTAVIRFEAERLDVLFRLGTVAGTPQVVLVQAGIRNFGERPVRLAELVPLMMDGAPPTGGAAGAARFLQVAGKPGDWLLTGLHAKTSVQLVFGDMQTAAWIHEQGGFYRGDGAGFLFGPVGDPVGYLSTLFYAAGGWAGWNEAGFRDGQGERQSGAGPLGAAGGAVF